MEDANNSNVEVLPLCDCCERYVPKIVKQSKLISFEYNVCHNCAVMDCEPLIIPIAYTIKKGDCPKGILVWKDDDYEYFTFNKEETIKYSLENGILDQSYIDYLERNQ